MTDKVSMKSAADSRRRVTILVPMFNEEEGFALLLERLYSVALSPELTKYKFEFLFVNDGSRDLTWTLIQQAQAAEKGEKFISGINLSRNFGKEIAMMAGIDACKSDALIIMDADLQDPPELIPQMLAFWEEGYQDVYARRNSRKGETWLKKWTSEKYYQLLQMTTHVPIQKDTGDFRLLDKKCVEALQQIRETSRNTKALFSWIGYKKKEICFDRPARAVGETKWKYSKLIELALDGITSFTTAPLRFATYVGAGISLITVLYALFIFVRDLFIPNPVHGYASTFVAICFLGGVQLLSIGILGEYIGRIFVESKRRPLYYVEEAQLIH